VPEAGEVEVVMVQAGRPMLAVVAPRRFETGTHLLEPTYDFDDQPTRARLLAGPPAAVRRVAAGGAPEPGVALVSLHGAGAAP
jgi:hypothetical protein